MVDRTSASLAQLRWRCRRGMLELDLLLNDFLDTKLSSLDENQLKQFEALLEYPDQVLLDLLLGNMQASDRELASFVNIVRAAQTVV